MNHSFSPSAPSARPVSSIFSTPPRPARRILRAGIVALLAGAALWLPTAAPAATITWSAPTGITGDSDVSTAGSLVGALNLGAAGVTSTTVNGVTFTPLTFTGTLSESSGDFAFSVATGSLTGFNGAGSVSAPFSDLTPAYQSLLSTIGGSTDTSTLTLTLSGLTVGETYQFQWWYNLSLAGVSFTTSATSGNVVTLNDNPTALGGGVGQYAIGSFVADGTTQTIFFDGAVSNGLNGLQLRDITPATAFWTGDQNSTWTTNTAGNTNWATDLGGLTDTGAIPGPTSDVIFSASNVTAASQTTTLGADITIKSLTINDPAAVTIGGANTLTIAGIAGTGIDVQAGAGLFTMDANLTFAGASNTITVNNTAGAVINGEVGGTIGLTKLGTGTLTLTGTSGYTGNTNVDGGKLTLTGAISATDQFYVGYSNTGVELEISGGGLLTDVSGTIGVTSTGSGTATVTGTGSKWTSTGDLNVGFDGSNNTLNVAAGGEVEADNLKIAGDAGSTNNEVLVSGTGSKLTVTNDIFVGFGGTSSALNLQLGGQATSVNAFIGNAATADNNTATVTGVGSLWTNTGVMHLGFDGSGNTLTVSAGGKVATTLDVRIGSNAGAENNKLTVTGTDSEFTNNATLYVGANGSNNTLEVLAGGTVTAFNLRLGDGAASSGNTVTVDGAGSLLTASGTQLRIGSGGDNNTLNITDGGKVNVTTGLTILGRLAGSDGNTVLITGPDSELQTVDLTIGRGGVDNKVIVAAGGNLKATGTTLIAEEAGSSGTLQIGDGAGAGTVDITTITGGLGTALVDFNHTDTAYTFAPILAGSLAVLHRGSGETILTGTNTYTGGTTINAGTLRTQNASALGTGLVTLTGGVLAADGTLGIDALDWGAGTVQLAPANGDIVNVTNALTNTGGGGAFNIDATGLTLGTYTLATFGSTNFVQPDFSATFLNTGGLTFVGDILLTASDVQLTLNGVIATGNVIQNSTPVGTPTFADFLINGAVDTGGPTENNTIRSLIFGPGGSLRVNNLLTVTGGAVNLPGGSSIQLNGFLTTSQLNMFINSLLSGNGGINGNLVNNGLVSPGNSPGSIRVSGNYTQSSTGTLRIEVGGTSENQFDRLLVGGRAKLGGTLELVRTNNFDLKRGDKITFLIADGGVQGEFARVSNPFTSETILEPTVVYGDTTVSLEMVRGSFEKYAAHWGLTPNQRAVAGALDSVSADDADNKALVYLDKRHLSKLPGDFDKIAPEELTSIFTISTSLANVQSINLQRRTDDIRHGASGFSASGLAMQGTGPGYSGSLFGVAGPTGKETKDVVAPVPEEKKWGAFLTGVGEWVDVGGDGNARGYDITTGGFTLGLDYKVCPNFVVGIAAGYAGTGADLTDGGDVWVNGGKLGLYATTFVGGWYADAAVTGGYNSYDTKRSALQGTARGSTDGGELNVLVGTGFDIRFGALTIGPTATFQYTLVGIDGFTETGSLAPLNIAGRNAESVRTQLGFKASYDWKVGGVLVRPEIRASWQHEYGDSSYALDASFANGAGNSFLVNGPELGRDSLLLGVGVVIQCSETFSTYFYYDGELGRLNYDRHGVSGGVRVAF